jgi:hypothetical protein
MAQDPAWRSGIKQRVARDRARLYRDGGCIAALENFLECAVRPH